MTEEERPFIAKIRGYINKIPIIVRKIIVFAILFIPTLIFILKLLGVVGMMTYIQDSIPYEIELPYTPLIMWTVLSTISLLMTLLYITNLFIQARDEKMYDEYEDEPYEEEEETNGLTVSEVEEKINRFAVPHPEPVPDIQNIVDKHVPQNFEPQVLKKNKNERLPVLEEGDGNIRMYNQTPDIPILNTKPEPETVELTEDDYQRIYHEKTGKWAVWRGKITKGYLEWKEEFHSGGQILKIHEPEFVDKTPEPEPEPLTYQELQAETHKLRAQLVQEHLDNQNKMTKEEFVQQLILYKARQEQLAQQEGFDEEEEDNEEEEMTGMEKFQKFLWKIKNRKKIKEYTKKQNQQRDFNPSDMPL